MYIYADHHHSHHHHHNHHHLSSRSHPQNTIYPPITYPFGIYDYFAKVLDHDQARLKVGPDQDPKVSCSFQILLLLLLLIYYYYYYYYHYYYYA